MNYLNRIQTVFNKVFTDAPIINHDTTKQDIGSWDSINHLSLILELEEEFGITISPDEMESLNSVQNILNKLNS